MNMGLFLDQLFVHIVQDARLAHVVLRFTHSRDVSGVVLNRGSEWIRSVIQVLRWALVSHCEQYSNLILDFLILRILLLSFL